MNCQAKVARGSNWLSLKHKIGGSDKKREKCKLSGDGHASNNKASNKKEKERPKLAGLSAKAKDKYVGLDCEMVGIGPDGKQSALARCCVVDFDGNKIYDKFVRPKSFVTDFRTQWSGVRKQDLRAGEAITFSECQNDVAAILKSRILVGHALNNDLDVLMLSHPRTMIRDTARFAPYMRSRGRNGGKMRPRALKELAAQYLGVKIQTGEHDPGEDARTAMFLYRLKMTEWEELIREERQRKIEAFKGKAKSNNDDKNMNNTSTSTTNHDDSHTIDDEANNIDRISVISKDATDKAVHSTGDHGSGLRKRSMPPHHPHPPAGAADADPTSGGPARKKHKSDANHTVSAKFKPTSFLGPTPENAKSLADADRRMMTKRKK